MDQIRKLTNLTHLWVWGIPILDPLTELFQFAKLTYLSLHHTQLRELPSEIENLKQLTFLDLSSNQLRDLPCELRNLEALQTLELHDNPQLRFPPEEIVELGVEGIKNFLRAAQAGDSPVWESKLLLIGEGGVGKTSVFNALNGKLLDNTYETGTVGIDIGDLYLTHPDMPEVQMHLNCWDFAGQDFNHATHQFFLAQYGFQGAT